MESTKKYLITGATSGIGKATAVALAKLGGHLLLVSRKKEKGDRVVEEIRRLTGNDTLQLFVADLSSQAEIRKLADEIKSKHRSLDVLVNNAGGIFSDRVETVDRIELTFALNHLGYFLLTNLLLNLLKTAPAGRIVNVSSQAHVIGRIEFDDPGLKSRYNAAKAYAQSKLANLMFTYELARILGTSTVTVNALHPGAVSSNFGRNVSGVAGFYFRHLGFLMRSAAKGAETVVWLSSSPQVEGVTGKYFRDKGEIKSSPRSYDEQAAKKLWQMSAQMTGLEI